MTKYIQKKFNKLRSNSFRQNYIFYKKITTRYTKCIEYMNGKNDDNTNNRMNNYNNRWYQPFYRKIKTAKKIKK